MSELAAPKQMKRPIAGNTATGFLKLLALVFMCCDHVGATLLPKVIELRILGRIAFPLYCWCLVAGYHYTRSVPKYFLRMLIVGVVSQPIYALAMHHGWLDLNIFFELSIAILGLWCMRCKVWLFHLIGPAIMLVLGQVLCGGFSYGWKGILLIYLLYAVQDSRRGIAAVMIAFCLFWGSTSGVLTKAFGVTLSNLTLNEPWKALLTPWFRLQPMAILSLPLMLMRFPESIRLPGWLADVLFSVRLTRVRFLRFFRCPEWLVNALYPMPVNRILHPRRFTLPKWLGYSLYPLHLAVLLIIQLLMGTVRL